MLFNLYLKHMLDNSLCVFVLIFEISFIYNDQMNAVLCMYI